MLVEAAFVLPILFLVTFGIIEYGMAFGNAATTAQAARNGARTVSTTLAPSGDRNAQAVTVSLAVRKTLLSLSRGAPVEMMIYKADTTTGKPTGQSSWVCVTDCWDFTWNSSTNTWNSPTGPGWVPDACGTDIDSAGVWVKVQHSFVTGFFGSGLTITKWSVMRIEPLPLAQCP